jgi:hypothetical protein
MWEPARVPDEPVTGDAGLRAANARLRGLLADRDAEVSALRAGLAAALERERRLELRMAELEHRARDGQLRPGNSELEGADRG